MWWSNLPRGAPLSREEMTGSPPESTVGDMLRLYGQYHTPIPDLIRAASAPVLLNIFDIQSLPAWHQGRVLLIGDAAHAVSPNAGQGASMALEDAMYLTKLFREEPQNDYPGVFAAFERGRKPRVERIVAEGRRRGGDKQIVSPFQSAVREVILTVVMNLFGRHADDWLHRYRIELQPLPGH